jgi:hypothetical protein
LSEAEARDLNGRVGAALGGLPPGVLAEVRAAVVDVHVATGYRPPRRRRRVFCAYFDPGGRRIVFRGPLVALLPADVIGPLVAHEAAHAVLWWRGLDWADEGATDALARSWGYDLAALDEWTRAG